MTWPVDHSTLLVAAEATVSFQAIWTCFNVMSQWPLWSLFLSVLGLLKKTQGKTGPRLLCGSCFISALTTIKALLEETAKLGQGQQQRENDSNIDGKLKKNSLGEMLPSGVPCPGTTYLDVSTKQTDIYSKNK